MHTDKVRLSKMLKENKISPEDHAILTTALRKKSLFNKIQATFLLNPFQKIAGFKALFLGLITLVLVSILGIKAKLFFLGPLSTINASVLAKQNIDNLFGFLLYQNVVCWLVLVTVLMITTKILQKNQVRIIDFLGTVALARFPTLIVTLYVLMLRIWYPSLLEVDLSKGYPLHYSFGQVLLGIPILIIAIWQVILYFYAFKESSGLRSKKLWLGFIVAIILSESIAQPLTTWFMN